jgi:hypothetical protein
MEVLLKQIEYHKIDKKAIKLQKVAEEGKWTQDHTNSYNRIDKLMTEAMLHAKKEVSRKYSDTYQWSPLISQAVAAKRYWEILLRKHKGSWVNKAILTRLRSTASITHITVPTIKDIVKETRASRAMLQEFQRIHIELQANHLQALAEARVLHRDPTIDQPHNIAKFKKRIERELKRVIKKERNKSMYKAIRAVLQPNQDRGGL